MPLQFRIQKKKSACTNNETLQIRIKNQILNCEMCAVGTNATITSINLTRLVNN